VASFAMVMLPVTIEEMIVEIDKGGMTDVIKQAYEALHTSIGLQQVTDADFSGSTLCSVIFNGHNIYASNVGDSRAILITSKKEVYQLTRDQKPDIPEEKARINDSGGIVCPIRSKIDGRFIGPNRVWHSK